MKKQSLVALILLLSSVFSFSQKKDDNVSRKYKKAVAEARQIVEALKTKERIQGMSVAVAVDGDIVWAEGFGCGDVEKHVKA